MLHLVREIGLPNSAPNLELFGAIVYYIDVFAERFHHAKEDECLFKSLRLRSADAAALVDRLTTEHRAGADKILALEQTLRRYEKGGPGEFPAFAGRCACTRRSIGNTCALKKTGCCRSPARISPQRLETDRRCVRRKQRSAVRRRHNCAMRRAVPARVCFAPSPIGVGPHTL